MATNILQFSAVIPAGTLITAPHTVPLAVDNWELESIDLEVPPGPAGVMGFYVANNGVQWIPQGENPWLVWDDVIQSWTLTDQPNASGWAIVGYNGGFYDHAVIVRMHVNPTSAAPAVLTVPQLTVVTTPLPAEVVTL